MGETHAQSKPEVPVVVCDPLDGSHNAEVGIPLFAISLSVMGIREKMQESSERKLGRVDVGVVASVFTDDEFYASKEAGSFQNGSRLSKAKSMSPEKSAPLHTVGIECGDVEYIKKIERKFTKSEIYKLRILGSAALSFCFLANGAFVGFLFVQPNKARTIDCPAGYLIAKEAGRIMKDLSGRVHDLDDMGVGFEHRVNIIGAQNSSLLKRLYGLVPKN
jgi:myo-inositol-1(or 4)-monophosphatase